MKKLAVIFAARYRDTSSASRRFAVAHGNDYRVHVVTTLDGIRGMLAGYQTYRPGATKCHENPKMARYFTRARQQLCWGTYLPLRRGPIFLTESIFKSAALHRAGFNSWSVLGSTISAPLMQQLRLLPYEFRCIRDGDIAGLKFSWSFPNGMTSGFKDLDEMTTDAVVELINGETP